MIRSKILIILFILSVSGLSHSQEENSGGSPYSIFGIGDLSYYSSTRTYSMGITGVSLFGNYVNNLNPATMTKLNATTISTNFNYGFLKSSNGTLENKVSNGNVLGVNIGIPFDQKRGWVMALGFNPASLVDYKIKLDGNIGGQPYEQFYSGRGGLSRINAGMSYNILSMISVGLEYNYAFGEIKNRNFINFNNSAYTNTRINREIDFQRSFLKGGIVFEPGKIFKSKSLKNLTIGFVYQSGFKLSATQDGIYTSSSGVDTVRLNSGTIDVPDMYGVGISNIFGKNFLLSADLVMQDWSKYKEFGRSRLDFQSSFRAGLGLEIIPDPNKKSFWGSTTYRIGGFYDKGFYKISNEDIMSYGVRAGINIPLSKYNSFDLGINYSIRGKTGTGLIRDEYLNLTAGVNFGELWFLRPREEDQ
ncbi:MAG: hypothetical protein ABIY50_13960 [Ignavibacteria bacterium]